MTRTERPLAIADLAPVLDDLSIVGEVCHRVAPSTADLALEGEASAPAHVVADGSDFGRDLDECAPGLQRAVERWLDPRGFALVHLAGRPTAAELCHWRNRLWPLLHVVAIYRGDREGIEREVLQGRKRLDGGSDYTGTLFACQRREHVLSPEATRLKFDANAASWNGMPGTPGYGHYRWMRRLVGTFAAPREGDRVLDFGCGAGWVGIEAAKLAPNVAVAAFDPSPEMVHIAEENARAEGIARFEARIGFGEAPPFPAEGEPGFDLVVSSGVLSFSPDLERWIEGLVRAVRPGGVIVVGDINPESRGMRARRATHPLLPVRELNGRTAAEVRSRLEARGFRCEEEAGYQLTRPMPQLMHLSEARLSGALSPALLGANRVATALNRATRTGASASYDSWLLRLVAPGA